MRVKPSRILGSRRPRTIRRQLVKYARKRGWNTVGPAQAQRMLKRQEWEDGQRTAA